MTVKLFHLQIHTSRKYPRQSDLFQWFPAPPLDIHRYLTDTGPGTGYHRDSLILLDNEEKWSPFTWWLKLAGLNLHSMIRVFLNWLTLYYIRPFFYDILNVSLWFSQDLSRNMTKPTECLCSQWRLRSAWASAQSDQSLRSPHEESLGPAHSEDSDQTGQMPRLIWVFAGRTVTCWFCHEAAHFLTMYIGAHLIRAHSREWFGRNILSKLTDFSLFSPEGEV